MGWGGGVTMILRPVSVLNKTELELDLNWAWQNYPKTSKNHMKLPKNEQKRQKLKVSRFNELPMSILMVKGNMFNLNFPLPSHAIYDQTLSKWMNECYFFPPASISSRFCQYWIQRVMRYEVGIALKCVNASSTSCAVLMLKSLHGCMTVYEYVWLCMTL